MPNKNMGISGMVAKMNSSEEMGLENNLRHNVDITNFKHAVKYVSKEEKLSTLDAIVSDACLGQHGDLNPTHFPEKFEYLYRDVLQENASSAKDLLASGITSCHPDLFEFLLENIRDRESHVKALMAAAKRVISHNTITNISNLLAKDSIPEDTLFKVAEAVVAHRSPELLDVLVKTLGPKYFADNETRGSSLFEQVLSENDADHRQNHIDDRIKMVKSLRTVHATPPATVAGVKLADFLKSDENFPEHIHLLIRSAWNDAEFEKRQSGQLVESPHSDPNSSFSLELAKKPKPQLRSHEGSCFVEVMKENRQDVERLARESKRGL